MTRQHPHHHPHVVLFGNHTKETTAPYVKQHPMHQSLAEKRKKKRNTSSTSIAKSSQSQCSDDVSCSSEDEVFCSNDMGIDELSQIATLSYKAQRALSQDRFPVTFSALTCVCHMVVNRAVQTPCCSSAVCVSCIFHWLQSTCNCPQCQQNLKLSDLKSLASSVGSRCCLNCTSIVTMLERAHC